MWSDITEPLNWFAEDDTFDDLTVPDWYASTAPMVGEWYSDATTQPALSLDSAALAGMPTVIVPPETDHTRRAMGIYAATTVLLMLALFGMFFVWGGRFSPSAPPRARHSTPLISSASLSGQTVTQQLVSLPPHGDVPVPKAHPQKSTQAKPQTDATSQDATTKTTGSSLWSSATSQTAPPVPPLTPVSPTPVIPTDTPDADPTAVPVAIMQIPSSLWTGNH